MALNNRLRPYPRIIEIITKQTDAFKLISNGIFMPKKGKTVAFAIIAKIQPTITLVTVSIIDNRLLCIYSFYMLCI